MYVAFRNAPGKLFHSELSIGNHEPESYLPWPPQQQSLSCSMQ